LQNVRLGCQRQCTVGPDDKKPFPRACRWELCRCDRVAQKTYAMCKDAAVNLAAFLEEFKAESFEHLEKLGSGLLSLERNPQDTNLIRKLFLSAHTIKGGASMLELKALKTLTHAFEDVLSRLREGHESADTATITLMLSTTDEIRALVEHNPTQESLTPDLEALVERLRARARGEAMAAPTPETATPIQAPAAHNKAVILEPSETARTLLRLQLETLGWTVSAHATPESALEDLAGASLVILPLEEEPGGVNGFAIAKTLRAQHPDLQIALSALEFSAAQTLEAEVLGAKPVALTSWRENPYWMAGTA
jgi:chemotaxis protein histidine kinase CheA